MIEQFEQYRKQKKLFSSNDKILLAVSGGIDSAVMLDIFIRLKYNIAVAHCNFQLRGEESERDEEFVRTLCNNAGIRLHRKRFRTAEYANEKGISIQMAARDLRYNWLAGIKEEKNYDLVAMGHNLNDSIETMLINLTRGTGINGLTGISPKSGYVIRPLLFATRHIIREYSINNNIEYREDSSNIKTKYTRNKIRHNVIPVLQQINPSVLHSIDETSDHLRSTYIIYEQAIVTKRKEIVESIGKTVSIKTSALKKLNPLEAWVYELFKKWNFGKQQLGDIIQIIHGKTGKQIFSKSHILTKDRDKIIITRLNTEQHKLNIINSVDDLRNSLLIGDYKIISQKDVIISTDPSYAYLDADLIKFPLTIRKWKEGDFFYPLGMQGRKKVSDLLVDIKIPLPEKDNIYVLEMNDMIVWVIGLRIDNRFKVTESSEEVLVIHKRED